MKTSTKLNVVFIYFIAISLLLAANGNANLVNQDQIAIKEIEDYLNRVKSFETNFTQVTNNRIDEKSVGKLYMKKPGKFKWQYQYPQDILIMNYGSSKLVYYNKNLDEITYAPLEKAITSVLAKDNVNFATDSSIQSVQYNDDFTKLAISDVKGKLEQTLTIVFDRNNDTIVGLEINSNDEIINVYFSDLRLKENFADDFFIFQNPRTLGNRTR